MPCLIFLTLIFLTRLPLLHIQAISSHTPHHHQMVRTASLHRSPRHPQLVHLFRHPHLSHMRPLPRFPVHTAKRRFPLRDNQGTVQAQQLAIHNHMLNHLPPRFNSSIPTQPILPNQAFPLPLFSINLLFQDRGRPICPRTVFRNRPSPSQHPQLLSHSNRKCNITYRSVHILPQLMGIFQPLCVQAV